MKIDSPLCNCCPICKREATLAKAPYSHKRCYLPLLA